MRILHISILTPGRYNGGEICVRQTLLSLIGNGYSVDYIGPEIEEPEIRELYDHVYELSPIQSKAVRIWDTLHGISNQRYRSWLKLSKSFDFECYDAIILEFTKLDYVLHRIPIDKTIVRAHNVEADYSARNYEIEKTFINWLDKRFAASREKTILQKTKRLIVLTKEDAERFDEIYGTSEHRVAIDPICLDAQIDTTELGYLIKEKVRTPFTLLLTGSLWFGPNYEGFKWFLSKVYPYLTFEKKVIMAGARPNDELKSMISSLKDCEIIDTPPFMEPYYRSADMYVAPIFDGAGMKVKVAEALSYGLPIAGTKHAFTGYQIDGTPGLYRCADASAMIKAIHNCVAMDRNTYIGARKQIRNLFDEHYSMKTSEAVFHKEIEAVSEMKRNTEGAV